MGLVEPEGSSGGEATPGPWGRAQARRRRRFLDRYEARLEQHQRGEIRPFARPIRVTVGVVLILFGVAIGWLPGPGFVIFAFPGSLLIASEWRRAALLMDRMENEAIPRMRRLHARLRGGPKRQWVEDDPQLWGVWEDRRTETETETETEAADSDHRRSRDVPSTDEDDARLA